VQFLHSPSNTGCAFSIPVRNQCIKKTAVLAGSTEYFKPNFAIVDNIHPIDSKGDEETLPSLQLPKTNKELEGLETEPRNERPGEIGLLKASPSSSHMVETVLS
jgi:hypothetical protein